MRIPRTAAAVLGTTALLALAAPAAHAVPAAPAKGPEPAKVTPAQAAPGEKVTVNVVCPGSTTKTITATSKAFTGGTVTLTSGPNGTYTGSIALLSATELTLTEQVTEKPASWGIDGKCPNGDAFTGTVGVLAPLTPAGSGHGGAPEPHGSVATGVGGSVTGTGTRELATGGALVAAGLGGFWLLRRRAPQS
ncbi:hypothetical protein [Streptomyces sp. NRRL B-24484]|uniref:hypothetical protein n=1 Tax=Streptomyces sp. NRRL B-24484 TaxID=1463833 RepID=UPI000693F885|nr:hypothetical protein [Streptomyces sp. NRRL B-24484]